MLSLRRQISPDLCHRATPSSPRTLRRLVFSHTATTWPPRSGSRVRVASFRSRPAASVHAWHVLARTTRVSTQQSCRRLRRGGHRPHSTPRLASRLPAALAAARRALARPVRDTGRTARLGPRPSALGSGGCAPEAQSPTTRRCHLSPCDSRFGSACAGSARQGHRAYHPPRLLTPQSRGGCVTEDTGRAPLSVWPHCRLLFQRLACARRTQSAWIHAIAHDSATLFGPPCCFVLACATTPPRTLAAVCTRPPHMRHSPAATAPAVPLLLASRLARADCYSRD